MKKLILLSMTLILILGLTESASAKSLIKRVDPNHISRKSVAMAIETYDGDFYDLSEFVKKKYKGNAKDIIKKGFIRHKQGGAVEANSIRYFFIEKLKKNKGLNWKMPQDDE